MKLAVILEQGPNNWGAYTPDDISYVIATAATRDEVIAQFRLALAFHLEVVHEEGMPAPDIAELEIRELVAD